MKSAYVLIFILLYFIITIQIDKRLEKQPVPDFSQVFEEKK